MTLLYYILPTQLRDHVPAVHKATNLFVWAIRRLDGQVHSYEMAVTLGIVPGSHTIDKRELRKIHSDLILGLSLLVGCLPESHLKPGVHHFVHYVQYTETHGCLRLYWMFYFER